MRNNYGISEIISVVILVAVAIGLAAGFYSWITSVQSPAYESGSKQAGKSLESLAGSLKIESVYVNTSGNSTIYVRNTGSTIQTNLTLYVNSKLAGEYNVVIKPGELATVNTTLITQEGETYTLHIISAQGAEVVKTIVAGD